MRTVLRALLCGSLVFLPLQGFTQQDRISAVEALLKQRPEDATLYFYLARFQCEAGDIPKALAALENVEKYGDGFLPARDVFEKCYDDAGFQRVRARMEARLPRLDYAPTAFELEDRAM